jgi:acetyl-CoA carboxylase biotin carboxylase subunit
VRKAGYRNAGTLEFLVDAGRNPYFLEMNTRLQVEHPVTEMVTGLDLVKLQIAIAQGERLPFAQGDLRQRGHAIECRVYAEDPAQGFLPSPGRIVALRAPAGPGVRDDSGVYEGGDVPIHYDPLISKLVAWGADRAEAIARMRRAVSEYAVLGVTTTLPFFDRVLRHPAFVSGDVDTGFIERHRAELGSAPSDEVRDIAVVAAAVRALRERASARAEPSNAGSGSAWRRRDWRDLGPAR